MSWMDSWSRPSKSTQFPPPIYLTTPDTPYCKSCGRVISSRRNVKQPSTTTTNPNAPQIKYCSERCRRTKPGKVDQQIEDAFVALLKGDAESYARKYPPPTITADQQESNEKERTENEKNKLKISKKGDVRNIISCSEIETLVFGSRIDPLKTAGRRKNRQPRGVVQTGEWKSVDMEGPPPGAHLLKFTSSNTHEDSYSDSESDCDPDLGGVDISRYQSTDVDPDYINFSAGKLRPSQSQSEVNGSVGGEKGWAETIEESPEMLEKRLEGQKRAKEREMVRRAARRGVVFGFVVGGDAEREMTVPTKMKKGGGMKGKGKKGKEGKGTEAEGIEDDDGVRRRKCEAVITKAAVVVEPSYAKGDWGIRWREGVQ